MANKAYASRLKGVSSTTDDSGGYDLGGHLKDALGFLATGQLANRASASTGDTLQDKIALEEVKARLKGSDPLMELKRQKLEGEIGNLTAPAPEGKIRSGNSLIDDPKYIDAEEQSAIDYRKERLKQMGAGDGLTPGQRTARTKATENIFSTVEMNKAKKETLDKALSGAENIPSGLFGKMRLGLSKSLPFTKQWTGIDDKQIQDSQEMKMALTMGSLAETAHTKGAISDQEMYLFKEASANDDFNSPAVRPVLEKIRRYMDAEESGLFGAYQQNFKEDPRAWFNGSNGEQNTKFNSPEEADQSGLAPGTIVMVQGRRYQI